MKAKKVIEKWRKLVGDRSFLVNLVLSIGFFIAATTTLKLSGLRAESIVAPALPDLFHSSVPLTDVAILSTFGFILIQIVFWLYFILTKPEELPYALKVYGLFVVFRSVFITITSLGAPMNRIDDVPLFDSFFGGLYFTQDLFPSGHTGSPFIGYLIIKNKPLKYFMLAGTFVMGASVLLLHVHYSIDVLGAFFVAYGAKGFYAWMKKKWSLLSQVDVREIVYDFFSNMNVLKARTEAKK